MAFRSVVEKKFLDSVGLKYLWEKIKKRYDSKLDSVVGKDNSITVQDSRRIGVKISKATGNTLQLKNKQGEEGLYVPTPPTNHKLTFGVAEKQYVYDGSKDVTVPVYTGDINE